MYCGWCDEVFSCWPAVLLCTLAINRIHNVRGALPPPQSRITPRTILSTFFLTPSWVFCLVGLFLYSFDGSIRGGRRRQSCVVDAVNAGAARCSPSYCCSHSATFAEQCVTPFTHNLRIFLWKAWAGLSSFHRMRKFPQSTKYTNLRSFLY